MANNQNFKVKNGLEVGLGADIGSTLNVGSNIYTKGDLIFEGATDDAFELTLSVTDPTADRTIILPDSDGTFVLATGDTTTSVQSELNLSLTVDATGVLTITGDAQGLATTDSPTFQGLSIEGATLPGAGGTVLYVDATCVSGENEITYVNSSTGDNVFKSISQSYRLRATNGNYSTVAKMLVTPINSNASSGNIEWLTESGAGLFTRLKIENDGKVVVGTTTSDSKFTVQGGLNDGITVLAANEPHLYLNTDDLNYQAVLFNSYGNVGLRIFNNDATYLNQAGLTQMVFYYNSGYPDANNAYTKFDVNHTEILRLTTDGAKINGNLVFEGATADAFETTFAITDPTADRTITFPDASGTALVSEVATVNDLADGYNLGGILGIGNFVNETNPQAQSNGLFVGNYAGQFANGATNSTFIGTYAGNGVTTGDNNTAVGASALGINTLTGSHNTAVGRLAGNELQGAASQNTIIGSLAGEGTSGLETGSNNIIIGYNAQSSSVSVSNEITIGNSSNTAFRIPGIGIEMASNGSIILDSDSNISRDSAGALVTVESISTTQITMNGDANNNPTSFPYTLRGVYSRTSANITSSANLNGKDIYQADADQTSAGWIVGEPVEFVAANTNKTVLRAEAPTADRVITFPDASGTVAFTSGSDVLTISNGSTTTTLQTADTLTIAGGTYLTSTVSGDTVTINHDSTSRTDTTSTASPAVGGTVDVVSSVTTNATGHVTAIDVKTVTLPSDADTLDGLDSTDFVRSTGNVTQSINGNKTFTGDINVGGDLTVDTDTLYVDSTNNQVSIGTTNPLANLWVESDSNTRIGIQSTQTTGGTQQSAGILIRNWETSPSISESAADIILTGVNTTTLGGAKRFILRGQAGVETAIYSNMTEAVTIDTSQNVSMASNLTVTGSLSIGQDFTSSGGQFDFTTSTAATTPIINLKPPANHFDTQIRLHTNNSGSAYQDIMNDGGVLKIRTNDANPMEFIVNSSTRIKLPQAGGVEISGNILPDATANNRNIGSASAIWNTVYATTFEGTATNAQYADLAEKYLADDIYGLGTVIAVGGDAEVTAAHDEIAHSVLGVVSHAPAFLMNKDLEHGTVIALKGRVPVKCVGTVRKGDRLAPSHFAGYATVDNSRSAWSFAIALEDGADGLVEAVIL